jgi:hypothetical protein
MDRILTVMHLSVVGVPRSTNLPSGPAQPLPIAAICAAQGSPACRFSDLRAAAKLLLFEFQSEYRSAQIVDLEKL